MATSHLAATSSFLESGLVPALVIGLFVIMIGGGAVLYAMFHPRGK
jgi:hypothetical protein